MRRLRMPRVLLPLLLATWTISAVRSLTIEMMSFEPAAAMTDEYFEKQYSQTSYPVHAAVVAPESSP